MLPAVSIRTKLMGAFLLSIFLSIGITLLLVSFKMRDARMQLYSVETLSELQHINTYIQQMFSQAEENALILARLSVTQDAIGNLPLFVANKEAKKVTRDEMTPQARELDSLFQVVLDAHPQYGSITIGATDGGFLEYPLATWPAGHDPRTRSWYKEQLALTANTNTSKAYLSAQGTAACAVTARISKEGKTLGVIDIDILLTSLTQKLSTIRQGKTGYLMLVEDSGVILADPAHTNLVATNIRESSIPAFSAFLDKRSSVITAEIDGISRVIVLLTGVNGWKLVAIMDEAEVFESINGVLWSLVLAGVGIAVVLLLLALFLANGIRRPIMQIVRATGSIADGNLNALPPAQHFEAEMLTLHSALEHMVQNLGKSIATAEAKSTEAEAQTMLARQALHDAEEARRTADQASRKATIQTATDLEEVVVAVSSAARDLHMRTHSALASAQTQRERSTEAAAAMEQMNASVIEVAASAVKTAENVEHARTEAEAGGRMVQDVVNSVEDVHRLAQTLDARLNELGERAKDVSRIMDMISDVADQTNLLALNAAIEAARAGEAGRGFAVVADEVRKLAEKTMAATGEVGVVVTAIQQGAKASVENMHEVSALIARSSELTSKAGSSLDDIVRMVRTSAEQVRAIANASEQQSAASEEITRSTAEVNHLAGEMAAVMKEAGDSVSSLNTESEELERIITRMTRQD